MGKYEFMDMYIRTDKEIDNETDSFKTFENPKTLVQLMKKVNFTF